MAVQAMNPYAFNQYQNYAAYADLNSIYNSDVMAGAYFGGAQAMYPPMGMGYGIPFTGGYNYEQYYDHMRDNLQFTSNYQLDMMNNQRNYELNLNAKGERVTNAVSVLNEKIVSSEQEQIVGAYNNLKEAVRSMYPNASEEDIDARAKTYYSRLTGSTISNDIRNYGSNSLWQGFKQGLGLGIIADRKTAEENIADISGTEVSRSQKAQKAIGKGLGAAAVGASIGAIIGGGPIGAAIGGGIGLLYGLVTSGIKRDQARP